MYSVAFYRVYMALCCLTGKIGICMYTGIIRPSILTVGRLDPLEIEQTNWRQLIVKEVKEEKCFLNYQFSPIFLFF
jgi:hypothetical protein